MTVLAAGCTEASTGKRASLTPEQRSALTAEQRYFLDDLDRREIAVDEPAAAVFITWYCPNQDADIADIARRVQGMGVAGEPATNEALNAAYSACRSTGKQTGG